MNTPAKRRLKIEANLPPTRSVTEARQTAIAKPRMTSIETLPTVNRIVIQIELRVS